MTNHEQLSLESCRFEPVLSQEEFKKRRRSVESQTMQMTTSEKFSSYVREYGRFEAAIQDLLVKNKNKRIQFHGQYLKDFIDLSFSHIYDAKTNSLKTKESNEDVRKYTSGKFAMLSSEIEKMQGKADFIVNMILQNLTKDLHDYVHSVEFQNMILQAEPALSSFMRINIDREIGKRIKKETELWISNHAPEIIEKNVKSHIFEKAEKLQKELESIKEKLTGISETLNSESASFKGIMWTVATGTVFVLNRVFWRAVVGPQAGIVLSLLGFVTFASAGLLDISNLSFDPNEVIQMSFEKRMQLLSLECVLDFMKKKYKSHLHQVYNSLYKKILPDELLHLKQSMDHLEKNREEIRRKQTVLDSFAKELGCYHRELAAIMGSQ